MQEEPLFGHIKRHDSILKTIPAGKVEGKKRARGREKCRWEDNIQKWTGLSATPRGGSKKTGDSSPSTLVPKTAHHDDDDTLLDIWEKL